MRIASILIALLTPLVAHGQTAAPVTERLIHNPTATVTSEDFEAFLLRVPEKHHAEVRASMERIGKAIDSVYSNRLLAEEAKRLGLDRDPRVQLRMRQIQEGYLAQLWTEKFQKGVEVPDLTKRAEEIYRVDRARFEEPARVSGLFLYVGLKGRTREEALRVAAELRARAVAGEDFEALVRNHTESPSFQRNKGRISQASEKDLEKAVWQAAQALPKEGDVTPPIAVQDGVVVLKLLGRSPARVKPFAEVREEIVSAERDRIVNAATDTRINELKAGTKVESDAIARLRKDIAPAVMQNPIDIVRPPAVAR